MYNTCQVRWPGQTTQQPNEVGLQIHLSHSTGQVITFCRRTPCQSHQQAENCWERRFPQVVKLGVYVLSSGGDVENTHAGTQITDVKRAEAERQQGTVFQLMVSFVHLRLFSDTMSLLCEGKKGFYMQNIRQAHKSQSE